MNHYTFISLGLLILGFIAGIYDKTILLGSLFLSSWIFLVIANINKIESVKATLTSFSIEAKKTIKEAEVTIVEMQELAKLVSKAALSQVKRAGRFGGYSDAEAEEIKKSFLTLLDKIKLSDKDKKYVLKDYNKFIEYDYAHMLLGGDYSPGKWESEEQSKCEKLRGKKLGNSPLPEEIEDLLKRNDALSETHKEILEDYRYFIEHKEYRRPEVIANYRKLRNNELKFE